MSKEGEGFILLDSQPQGEEDAPLPMTDFSTFILSLTTSAMVHLGEAPSPDGTFEKDLTLAQQSIDILEMLQLKTKGNLSEEEAKLIESLLYDLHVRFVKANR
jgi:hypothetical protein